LSVKPHLVDAGAYPIFEPDFSNQERLSACYDAFVDEAGDEIITAIVYDRPLTRLSVGISEGKITFGQWVLHVSLILEGQISNGGVRQLFDNFPQLVEDCIELLEFLGLFDFRQQVQLAAGDLPTQVCQARKKYGEGAAENTWFEFTWESDDAAMQAIDEAFQFILEDRSDLQKYGKVPQDGYCDLLCRRATDYVLKNIDQFAKSSDVQ